MADRSETTHEEQGAKRGKKVRTGSREALADAEARLARVELAIADGEDKFEEVNQRIEELDMGKEELREEMQGALNLTLDKCLGQVKTLEETFKAEIVALKEELVRVTDELILCKKVIAQGGHVEVTPTPSKLDIPKPKFYKGDRNAKELDNFLWGVEQYFKALGITEDASKIDTATLYLDDTARMWWRRRQRDVEKGTCTINTWAEFKKELKQQFYLVNAEEEARAKLRRVQHKGTLRDYVKDFTEVLLEIPDYPDKEAFFAFVDGLQNWVKIEIQRRGAQDLATAISVAESLIEFKKPDKPKTKDKGGKGKSGGEGNQSKAGSHKPESSKGSKEFMSGEKPPLKCFLCEGPHRARDCPKKAKLSALVKESEECEQEEAKVSSLQLLIAIKAKVEMPENGRNGRMFVEAKAGDRVTKALVDCGASHNFLQVEEARRLGEWTGPVDFFVVTVDDYPIVLGMEFLDKVKAVLVPFANTMCTLEEGNSCMVPLEREAKIKAKSISAMQLAKGMKKAQPTYVAAIKEEEDPLSRNVPGKVQKVLEEFVDIMTPKTRRFWLEDGVLVTKGSQTYIPKWQGLRREIIKECHDSKWAGHPGVRRTLALVERAYYWPQMRDDIELFWMELFMILGSEINFSTSFHPQTDGQTERVNTLLELYLRHYVSANQKYWAKSLDIAQFSYNLQKRESTGASPFEIATGQQPMTPHTLAVGYTGPNPAAIKFAKGWHEKSDMARVYLAKATKRMKKWADAKRRHLEFEEGDLVMPYHKDMEDPSRGEKLRAPTAITEVPERDVEEILAHRVVPRRGSHSSYMEYLVKWKGAPDSEASWEHELTLWNHKNLIEAYK
ncbi:Transposon Ty3-I Gag-Pol polyprotein [Senna tora]|uniref:Transposon Ty3-I Gag-Pol polyprotein n=1 Tax=Senna tora TaxID=362788 RepID=A0A834WI34_9FABA|nr:Transposon Ty3-I Gag-Pol polyprotein [Senna tora]